MIVLFKLCSPTFRWDKGRLSQQVRLETDPAVLSVLDTRYLFNQTKCRDMECVAAKVPVHPTSRGVCPFFGSHHKMGTYVSSSLMATMCPRKSVSVFKSIAAYTQGLGHFKPEFYNEDTPVIHSIRDPLETIVSAYQYHLVSNEMWLHHKGIQKTLRNATLEDGLELEYQLTMAGSIRDAILTHEFLVRHAKHNSFTVRMGQVRSEFQFRATVYAIEHWLGLKHLPWWALRTCCFVSKKEGDKGARHFSKVDEKVTMRRVLMERHADEIREARRRLGFPLVGLEE